MDEYELCDGYFVRCRDGLTTVYDEDGDCLFELKGWVAQSHIREILEIFKSAFARGMNFGRDTMAAEIRTALRIPKT